MKNVLKHCVKCDHDHKWGVVKTDEQGVPLYGSWPCFTEGCECDDFEDESTKLPAGWTQKEAEELWSKTSFLNPQAPLQTRIWVHNLMQLGAVVPPKGLLSRIFHRRTEGGPLTEQRLAKFETLMEKQWPEFMGLMLSQVTDIRGTLVGSEAKFGNLVAHTDEILESMQGVVQLSERLAVIRSQQAETERRLDKIETLVQAIADKMGIEQPEPSELEEQSRAIFHESHATDEPVDVDHD